MKHVLLSLFLVLSLSSSLFAKILESKKMTDVLNYANQNSIVVFDLDNTIMEAAQSLGSDQWFEHRINQFKSKGIAAEQAVALTVSEWEAINSVGEVQLVEEITPSIVRHLQDENIPTMGLTARPATFLEKSLAQLRKLNVPLYRNTISEEEITIKDKDVASFKEGLMSVGSNNKGTILVKLLAQVGATPERIIFVDDKVKNVTNVDNALNAASIESFALRYGAADPKVEAFDAKLADFELEYFQRTGVVLKDDVAKKLMH